MARVGAVHLTFTRDAQGRPVAIAPEGVTEGASGEASGEAFGAVSTANDLAAFLTEEVHWPFYASLLLDQAVAAPTNPPVAATGNAYAVTCDADTVTIEHLHIPGRRPIRLGRQDFVAAMTAWRAHLEAGA